jgi:hypothetical protein
MVFITFGGLTHMSRYSDGPSFDSRRGQDFPLFHSVQTGPGAHPAYLMGTEGSFSGGKATGA